MDNYNHTYYYLFNRISDLIEELKSIQQKAEQMFITFDVPKEDDTAISFPK